jgi:hypothetical protein
MMLSRADCYDNVTSCKFITGGGWWSEVRDHQSTAGTLSQEDRNQLGSVSVYHCPTRGRANPANAPYEPGTNWARGGPQHDYAIVGRRDTSRGDTSNWWQFANIGATNISSPFWIAISDYRASGTGVPSGGSVTTWSVRDTMAWWADGSSKQLLIGEKHFPQGWEIGKCDDDYRGDCSYLTAFPDGGGVVTMTRTFDEGGGFIARGNEYVGLVAEGVPYFGSPHAGTCNFLVGDGSVHGLSATASPTILRSLAGVRDGQAASLP